MSDRKSRAESAEAEVERLRAAWERSEEECAKLRASNDRWRAKVAAVEALHWPHKSDVFVSGTEWCDIEGEDWPCPTIRTLRGERDVDPHPDTVGALEARAAATTGEADEDGYDDGLCECGRYGSHLIGCPADGDPAPVSSGEVTSSRSIPNPNREDQS